MIRVQLFLLSESCVCVSACMCVSYNSMWAQHVPVVVSGIGQNTKAKKLKKNHCTKYNHQVFSSLLFLPMCQALERHTGHTSTSSLISFISLFSLLIFTSASFTIALYLREVLTSVAYSLGPKAMIRVMKTERKREEDRQSN